MASRRRFLALTAAAGVSRLLAQAAAAPITPASGGGEVSPYRRLSETRAKVLSAFGELLLPGAAAAGLPQYIDRQLDLPAANQVLMIRYLGVPPPYESFYMSGLDALDGLARARHRRSYAELPTDAAEEIVGALARGDPEPWSGPPASLFYFVVRNDVVDVVYGTQAGFAALSIPYMAHISPPAAWPK